MVRSRCVGRVGLRGVVVKDSVGVFEIVVEGRKKGGEGVGEDGKGDGKGKDRKVVIPKEGTVFRFRIPLILEEEGGEDKTKTGTEGDGKEDVGDKMQLDIEGSGNTASEHKPTPKPRELIFELHGDQFKYRAANRANRQFKAHFLKNL